MASRTIIIASGGTGGHLYPTIAVADEIKRLAPDVKVIFVGTKDRIESREVPRAGYEFFPIDIHAPGKSLDSMVMFPFKMLGSLFKCLGLMSREKPMAMLGGGAYLSVPVGLAAWAYHIPIALLEINSVAGAANKLLSKLANKLFLAYPESRTDFGASTEPITTISGTPVRHDLGADPVSPEQARQHFGLSPNRPTILVFGGSLGAKAINEAMKLSVETFANAGYSILWQCGKGNNVEEYQREFAHNPSVKVQEYIFEMEKAYAAADLVICRAGASSLAELSHLAKPAVLVPYPYAAANHQEKNARAFEQSGAALVLRDEELKARLVDTVTSLMNDAEKRSQMAKAMQQRENKDATRIVAEWLISPKTR